MKSDKKSYLVNYLYKLENISFNLSIVKLIYLFFIAMVLVVMIVYRFQSSKALIFGFSCLAIYFLLDYIIKCIEQKIRLIEEELYYLEDYEEYQR